MLKSVPVRGFDVGDFEGAYHLDQSCYAPGIAYSRFELEQFLRLPGARAWVAEEASQLIGFVLVRRLGQRGHVITLDVRADSRRRGLGTELLATAEHWLQSQGVRRVRLETAVENAAAVAFWEHAGYRITGQLPRYYLGRDDAYRMEKELA